MFLRNTKKGFLLFFVTLFTTNIAYAEDIDLFILAGQSNALGWAGDASHYPKGSQRLDAAIRFYWSTPGLGSSAGKWTTLQAQDGIYPHGHFGPEVTFARSLKAAGYNPAIFKYSRGSTSIAHHWRRPGEGRMYDQMINEFKQAWLRLRQEGHRVNVRGFIWIQGESDAETPEMAAAYQARLKMLIDHFRRNVARNPSLAVVLGVDERHHLVKRNPQVISAQQALAKADRFTAFTSMMHLEKANDGTHLSPRGLEGHGQRLFGAYQKLTGGDDN